MDTIFGNGSATTSPTWRPEPAYRGTYGILSTCLITLALCVWTAVHLNIPAHDEKPPSFLWPWKWPGQTFRKFGWMMWGIIAPEVVAFTAYRQYMDAAALKADFQKRFPVDPEAGTGRRNEWTLTHSFFAAMGGYEIAVEDKAHDFLPSRISGESRTGVTLTIEGLRWLAEKHPHLIEDTPVERIQDKSKGSAFAETLVCLQAIWFCIQCITRLQQRLGISLLELNTFGHALCTLAIYMVWWRKPLDIEEPLQVNIGPRSESEAVAFMCMAGKLDRDMPELIDLDPRLDRDKGTLKLRVELSRVKGLLWRLSSMPANQFPSRSESTDYLHPTRQTVEVEIPMSAEEGFESVDPTRRVSFRYTETVFTKRTSEPQPGLGKFAALRKRLTRKFRTRQWFEKTGEKETTGYFDIPNRDLRRYLLVASNADIPGWFDRDDKRYKLEHLVTDRVRNSPKLESIRTDWMLYLGFGLVGLVYGGLHCIAWYAPFQTEVERVLWRASSVAIAANGLLLLLLYTWELSPPIISPRNTMDNLKKFIKLFFGPVGVYIVDADEFLFHPIHEVCLVLCGVPLVVLGGSVRLVYDVLICASVVAYIAARVFLLVECFISLAHLPESAYLTPEWSRYVPHII